MVWAAFSSLGKLEPDFISTKIDAREYQEVLSYSLMPYLHSPSRQKLVYQQDNAGVHVSRNRRRSDPHGPAFSRPKPYGEPLGIMVRHIFNDGKQYDKEAQLMRAIPKAWNEIQPGLIQNGMSSSYGGGLDPGYASCNSPLDNNTSSSSCGSRKSSTASDQLPVFHLNNQSGYHMADMSPGMQAAYSATTNFSANQSNYSSSGSSSAEFAFEEYRG
uniref:Uncharacterized protein n=1 Tax=Ditylenchus dipsaci TaxID=166011 RepID=A0A915E6R2_9BILA